MHQRLHPNDQVVVDFFLRFKRENGTAPTQAEIMQATNRRSRAGISHVLNRLAAAGVLEHFPARQPAYVLNRQRWDEVGLSQPPSTKYGECPA